VVVATGDERSEGAGHDLDRSVWSKRHPVSSAFCHWAGTITSRARPTTWRIAPRPMEACAEAG
jgi:hypothetical protein